MASYSTVKGIFVEIGADTSKLQAAFRDAEGTIKATQSQLKELNSELKLNPGNKNLLTDKYNALQKSVKDAQNEVQVLKDTQKQMDAEGVDKNSDAYKQLQAEIDVAEQKVKDLEKQTKEFGSVGAQRIAAAGEKIKGVGEKMADVGGKLTAGVTTPLIAGATAAVNAYGDVDKQFNLVKQTMGDTNNTAEDFNRLWDQMGTSAKNSVYGMQDAADALLNFARQGFTANEATNMLTPAMSLAVGTGTELDTVTAGLGNALKMFGEDSDQAATYANVLATAQAQANTDTTQLFEAMSVAGPICKTVGWDVKDLATITDLFGNAGISGSEGANALKTGLARLASPAKSGAESMDKLGLSTGQTFAIFDDQGNLKSMPVVLDNLRRAFDGLSQQEQLEAASNIFGKNQMAKWMTLIASSPDEVQSLRSALDDTGDSANNMANALMSGTGGAIEQLKSTFDVFKVEIGEQLAPAFEPVIKKLTELMNKMMNLDPETQQMIIRIAAVAATIGPLLLVGGKLLVGLGNVMAAVPKIQGGLATLKGAFGGLHATVNTLKGGFTALKVALAGPLGPILAIVAAVAVLVAAFKHLWDTNEQFRNAMTGIWNEIKGIFLDFVNTVKADFAGLNIDMTAVVNVMKAIWDGFCQLLAPVFEGAFQQVANILRMVTGVLSGVLKIFVGLFTGDWNKMLDGIKQVFSSAWTFVTSTFQNVANILKGILNTILGFFGTDLEAIFNKVKATFENIRSAISEKMDAAKRIVKGALDSIKQFFDNIKLKLNLEIPHISVEGGEAPWGIGGKGRLPSFNVDWYDKGGIFSSPSVIGVGERRPEIVGALDDFRQIVREESGGGFAAQMVELMQELVDQRANGLTVNQSIYAGNTSYVDQQRQAAKQFKDVARAL